MISFLYQCLYKSISNTIDNDGIEHAGYLAFVFLLSLFPFLFFFMSILGAIADIIGNNIFIDKLFQNIWAFLPPELIAGVKPRIVEIISTPSPGFFTIAIITAIWTASSAVEGLKTVLNKAYRAEEFPAYIFRRFMSIIQFFFIVFAILGLVIFFTAIPAILQLLKIEFAQSIFKHWLWTYSGYSLVSISIFLGTWWFNVMIPDVRQNFRDTLPGSVLFVILCGIFTWLLSLYITYFPQVNLIYGSLASIIAVLLFFYIVSMCFIISAEFNYQLKHHNYNNKIKKH